MTEWKKPRKPTEKQYREAKADLLESWAPTVYPCSHCKWPVVDGYCCTYCGSSDPREHYRPS